MEPWLDELSDEWASNKQSSSPNPSNLTSQSSASGFASGHSQSRIPHLSQNRSRSSRNGSLLQSRSTEGVARADNSHILAEQTFSKLNVVSQKANVNGRSTIPRRASTAFSGSLNSVQHHTIQHSSRIGDENTPEWKRRLARGEDVGGDGCDLFGPTRLEGMFKQPPPSRGMVKHTLTSTTEPVRPWSMPEQYQSIRAPRGRIPEMDVLAEEDEEGLGQYNIGSDGGSTRKRALRGLVRDRVLSLEHNSVVNSPSIAHKSSLQRDPRMRTSSGQEEIQNEGISPITISRQNTIREEALKRLTEAPKHALDSKLEEDEAHPRSRSSDDGIVYGHKDMSDDGFGEITSFSLPEDLSMGTQDFAIRGGFVNRRRGGRSNEGSFRRRAVSSSVVPSLENSVNDLHSMLCRSSPPPYTVPSRHSGDHPVVATAAPTTPRRPQGSDSTDRPRSSGSPLKLFGNYDTFTNNKLLRRMSQFEHNDEEDVSDLHDTSKGYDNTQNMRISHFGKGDLDKFPFNESVERQAAPASSRDPGDTQVFDSLTPEDNNVGLIDLSAAKNHEKGEETEQGTLGAESCAGESKRVPSSLIGGRAPKRRRTLPLSKSNLPQEVAALDANTSISETTQLAGKKRKDARYDPAESAADPATLASRQILRPRAALRRTSAVAINEMAHEQRRPSPMDRSPDKISDQLSCQLASFRIGISNIVDNSRKPSVTTQDFLNEATKIMQIIRQRGKPKIGLSSVEEPHDGSEINPDSILDLEVEGEETTIDNFSRPPSRNGSMRVRRMASPDPHMISHLQKYRDGDDLELLVSSKLGSLHLLSDPSAQEAALIPLPEDDQEREEKFSSSANVRIREDAEHQRERKHSTSSFDGHPSLPTHSSSATSSGTTTVPTCSSASSGNKGRIPPGVVLVPEKVGAMSFDHSTKSWVHKKDQKAASPSSRKANSEQDPFDDIPDLSIDEQKEAVMNALVSREVESPERSSGPSVIERVASSLAQTRDENHVQIPETTPVETTFTPVDSDTLPGETVASLNSKAGLEAQEILLQSSEALTDHDEEVEHEIRIHDGRASEAPPSPHRTSKKARAVTVAFSSPLVPAGAYYDACSLPAVNHSITGDGLDEEASASSFMKTQSSPTQVQPPWNSKPKPPFIARMFVGRPVSTIDEQDEDNAGHDLSLVHLSQPNAMTPARKPETKRPVTHNKIPSMICLTPLSEFTVHQSDHPHHLETSYVAQRSHPTSLQQAHGSLTLAVDELMKAIIDAEPYELYWEHLRRLDLTDKRLRSLHGLGEYCSATEELLISGNELSQLAGVPISVRTLLAKNNQLSQLTSWGHLRNLHYLDISGNVLESLDGLSSLTHLRELIANKNRIRNLDGILDLNHLLHLELQGNELTKVDFEGGDLSRLHHLDLSNNRLASVRKIDALPALRDLYLEKNKLREFGCSDGTYPRLRELRLSFNHLEVIDLAKTPSIEVVYLDNNRIQTIQGLGTARHLHTLSVREQSDSAGLLNTILSTSNECCKIYLSSNPAPPEGLTMSSLPHLNLKYLELASCGLTHLPADFGKKIPNCRTLNLNFNAVKDLQPISGCGRLNKFLIAGNRLNTLRRTCMVLARLPALTKIDLRDNPLTVGFYPPLCDSRVHGKVTTDVKDQYILPLIDPALDSRWILHLDEGTRMKRRTIELFLARGCEKLIELDGMAFDQAALLQHDEISRRLANMGVIARVSRTVSAGDDLQEEEALPLDADTGF